MNIPTILSAENIQALGWMLVHFVWQGLVIAVVLAVALGALAKPRLRYAAACAALLGMVLMPLATIMWYKADRAAPAVLAGEQVEDGAPMAVVAAQGAEITADTYLSIPAYESFSIARAANLQEYMPAIVLGWGAGVLLLSLRLLGGGWLTYRLKRVGTSPLSAEWQRRVRALARRQGIRRGVEVVTSTAAAIPMVVGVFRPVVLIPVATFMGLSPQQLEAILIHELAHVRRWDNLVNVLQRLVETALFFHPAVWWVSHCIRVEREYCCDDAAVAGGDARTYVAALAAIEERRSPMLAAAASDGSLLSRARRLLAVDGVVGRDGLSSNSAASLVGLVAVLALAGFAAEGLHATEAETPEGEQAMSVMVDVNPARPANGSSLTSSLSPVMRVIGQPEWTPVQLQGVMGHLFAFQMREGGQWVYHDSFDWGTGLEVMGDMAEFQSFDVTKEDTDIDLPALKREARDAVVESLEQGIPAMVWQPMSLEQKADGSSAYCWGLIVGYDETAETYTVRHPWVSEQYAVRYDAIGHADPAEWFNVRVFSREDVSDDRALHIAALQNAIAFANGTRYGDSGGGIFGFAAYELWREAFGSEEVSAKAAHHHSTILKNRRRMAGVYLRELVNVFPAAAEPLAAAAAEYDRELQALEPLHDLISAAHSANGFSAEDRAEAGRLVGAALKANRAAVAQIEAALAVVEGS